MTFQPTGFLCLWPLGVGTCKCVNRRVGGTVVGHDLSLVALDVPYHQDRPVLGQVGVGKEPGVWNTSTAHASCHFWYIPDQVEFSY